MAGKSSHKTAKRASAKKAKPSPGDERKAVRTAPKKSIAPAGKKSRTRATAGKGTNHQAGKAAGEYYLIVEVDELRISTDKPAQSTQVHTAENFDEAKEKAIDFLIALIDGFERRLWEIKQSRDFENYKELVEAR